MTARQWRAARLLLGALLLTGPALVGFVGSAAPAAAADGVLAVEPAQGKTDWGNIRLLTNRTCPSGTTNVIVEIVGANFPTGSFAVGNSEISGFSSSANGEGLVIPLFGSWDTIAEANGGKRLLDGTAELTLICIDQPAEDVLAEITGKIEFTKSGGGPSTYEQAAGPRLVSGLPYEGSDVVDYVYRYDLPPGSPGGPPIGGPTEPPGVTAVNAAFAAADGAAADGDAGSTSDVSNDSPDEATGSDTSISGDATATQAMTSDRSSGPPTALIVGLVLFAGATATGFVVYERARRAPPSQF